MIKGVDEGDYYKWLVEKLIGWGETVQALEGVEHRYPLEAYEGMQKYLQKERDFFAACYPQSGYGILSG